MAHFMEVWSLSSQASLLRGEIFLKTAVDMQLIKLNFYLDHCVDDLDGHVLVNIRHHAQLQNTQVTQVIFSCHHSGHKVVENFWELFMGINRN